jgi:WD40-like Beta Propeller Repeat
MWFLNPLLAVALVIGASLACFAQSVELSRAAPRIFAPGVISGSAHDASPAFTPDGKTAYFSRSITAVSLFFYLISKGRFGADRSLLPFPESGMIWSRPWRRTENIFCLFRTDPTGKARLFYQPLSDVPWKRAPTLCHPDRSAPGFPTARLSAETTYSALREESRTKFTEATALNRKYGGAQWRDLQCHRSRRRHSSQLPHLLLHSLAYTSNIWNIWIDMISL